MGIQANNPTNNIVIPVSQDSIKRINNANKQAYLNKKDSKDSQDKFVKHTMLAANVGTGVGLIGSLLAAVIGYFNGKEISKISDDKLRSNIEADCKSSNLHKIFQKEPLENGIKEKAKSLRDFSNFSKSKWTLPITALGVFAATLFARWTTAGIYNWGSSAKKSFKKDNDFDKQQIKETTKNTTIGAGLGAGLSVIFNSISGKPGIARIISDILGIGAMFNGISAIDKAKAIKKVQKQQN